MNDNNHIDLVQQTIRIIAFHVKHWKLFAVALLIGSIAGFYIVSRPLKTKYQHHIYFSVGELPPSLVSQCISTFSYDSLGQQLGNFSVTVKSDNRKKGSVEAIVTTSDNLDLRKFISSLDKYVQQCGLVKGYQQIDLNIKKNLEQQIKNVDTYYKKIDSLHISDKGFVYGNLIESEINLKKALATMKFSDVAVSNYYTVAKSESKARRYVMTFVVILVLFSFVYIYLFIRSNISKIKDEIRHMK